MTSKTAYRILTAVVVGLGLWLGVRYVLPVLLPFLIGSLIAFSAEPGVRLLEKKLSWRRFPASMLCVSLTMVLLTAVVSMLGAVAVRELGSLTRYAPTLGQKISQGLTALEDTLLAVAEQAPERLRPMLTRTVLDTFQDGSTLLNGVTTQLPSMVAGAVSWVYSSVLTVGTAVLAGYMISTRLPRIRSFLREHLPETPKQKILPALRQVKKTFGKWLFAQVKLMLVTFGIVGIGLTILGIPYGILWAGLIALVDAVPILGTGTVMVPWAVICFIQGNSARGLGLLVIFAGAWLARNLLEPRFIGKSLGLDPLWALVAFYVGLKLWGLPGMILLPIGAALVKSLLQKGIFRNSQIFHKETS